MRVLYVCVSGAVNNYYQNKIKKTKLKFKKIESRVGSRQENKRVDIRVRRMTALAIKY